MTVRLWSGVAVAMTSAKATAQTITGITKASPAVVTTSGTLPTNGTYVFLSVQGMSQVNERAFRVAAASGSTFELEGLDSTTFDTFSTGSFSVHTLGTNLTTARNVSGQGGEANFVDVSTIHDTVQKQIPGAASAASFSFECFWDPGDAGLISMKAASDTRSQQTFLITFPDGAKVLFAGYVSATLLPGGSGQDVVTTPVTVTMFGVPTIYST